MNVNGKNGKQFVYSEMGVKWQVTQLEHVVKGDKHHFKFRIDHIIYDGGMPQPPIGHVTEVMYTEGFEYYSGWRVEEVEEDPFVEREFPLRKGSIIRSAEGILFSRSSPGMIPITTDPEVEYNDILDAYGDALDDHTSMMECLLILVNKRSIPQWAKDQIESCLHTLKTKTKTPATGTEESDIN